ncbi:MAG: insulinase family protein [Myxococcales bacterium]|nr:insulinase family protein [Myxococcales bacterium]
MKSQSPVISSLALMSALALGCGAAPRSAPETPSAATEAGGEAAAPAVAKEAPPPSEPPREIHFPPIMRSETPNGLELNAVELRALPLVQLKLVIKSGSADDPDNLPGLAQLTASMLKEGTRRSSSAKLAEAIDFLGAHLSIHNDEEHIYLEMRAMSEHFERALGLLAEVAMGPRFDAKELAKLKTRELARLELQRQNPRFLASREFHRAAYGEHPYAEIDTSADVIKRLNKKHLVDWHRKHFAPNNAFLVVVGDVGGEQVKEAAGRFFKGWTKRKLSETTYAPVAERAQRQVVIVDRPESVQSVIYYGNLALSRGDADYIPLMVANQVLGGSAASRLFMDLREKRSLTYGAYSDVGERVKVAPFIAFAAVRNEVTAEAVKALTEHLDRIVSSSAQEQELADAKRFLIDRFPLSIDTAGKIAGLVAELRSHGLPDDYWDRFRKEIAQVSAEGALQAAKKYIKPAQALIVVVGKAAEIKGALSAYGPVTVLNPEGEVIVKPEGAAGEKPAAAAAAPAAKPAAEKPAAEKPAAKPAPAKPAPAKTGASKPGA